MAHCKGHETHNVRNAPKYTKGIQNLMGSQKYHKCGLQLLKGKPPPRSLLLHPPGLSHFISAQLYLQMTQALQSTESNKHSLYPHARPEQ
jgi:hypothetical protein